MCYITIHIVLFAATTEPLRYPTVPSTENISTLAKCLSDSLGGRCEKYPIYSHWFGIEMYNAYVQAKMQLENDTPDPIIIEFQTDASNSDTYEIKRDSLQNAVSAIRVAATLPVVDDMPQRCGLMSSSLLRRSELAYSSLYARALDRFIFTKESDGACLHQVPCRKRDSSLRGNPESADVYIVPFDSFRPGNPLLLTDVKRNDDLGFSVADRESSLYSLTGVDVNALVPLLIGIPGTTQRTDLQLHVIVPGELRKLTVATGVPWNEALLCTLNAAVRHLCKHGSFSTSDSLKFISPFRSMGEYSVIGPRKRVFVHKTDKTVYKFYDSDVDSFLKPQVMKDLIEKVRPLPRMTLYSYPGDRLFRLSYKFIPGNHESFKCKMFAGVVKVLAKMHKLGFVHGDVRRMNMVFCDDDNDSHLIDFDFVGRVSVDVYPSMYNSTLRVRHPSAKAHHRMEYIHDRYSLNKILESMPIHKDFEREKEGIIQMLDTSCPLDQVAEELAKAEF